MMYGRMCSTFDTLYCTLNGVAGKNQNSKLIDILVTTTRRFLQSDSDMGLMTPPTSGNVIQTNGGSSSIMVVSIDDSNYPSIS